jgi:D-3-phosphoglycerate dehydrogenase
VAYLLHGTVKNAVNVPSLSVELMTVLRPYALLAEKMGSLQSQLIDSGIEEVRINYTGKVSEYDVKPLTAALLKGLLTPILKDDVNFVNAPYIASARGIKIVESKTSTSEDFSSLIMCRVKSMEGENIVSGTIFGKTMPMILRINNFYLEAIPEGHILLIRNGCAGCHREHHLKAWDPQSQHQPHAGRAGKGEKAERDSPHNGRSCT